MAMSSGAAQGAGAAEESEDEDPDGGSFGARYDLQDSSVLGVGTSGTVREAICRRTGRRVAVKCYMRRHLSADAMDDLQDELQLHAGLSHPGIVRLEDAYASAETIYAVMEPLRGGELLGRLAAQRKPLRKAEAACVARQLLEAVAYMHARGVSHRDIKPENVVFAQPGCNDVKIVDFGLAARFEHGSKSLTGRCGSMQYVAPEVLAGIGPYDERVDVWSVGAVTYCVLTGRHPFIGDRAAVYNKNLAGAVDWCPAFEKLPADCKDFVRWLLTADPEERPLAAEALQHPWLEPQESSEHAGCLASAGSQRRLSESSVQSAESAGSDDSSIWAWAQHKDMASMAKIASEFAHGAEACLVGPISLVRCGLEHISHNMWEHMPQYQKDQ